MNLAAAIRALKAGKDINYEGAAGPQDFDDNGDPTIGAVSGELVLERSAGVCGP